jgi:hemerythrin
MKLVEWNDKLSIGVSSVDEQHKKLVGILNELYEAVQARQGHEKLGTLFNELIDYTVYHFRHEEALFAKTGYPAASEHKKEHEELTRQVLEKKQKYEDGAASTLPIELLNFLRRWLLTHIAGSDKRSGPHLIAEGIK